MNELRLTLDPGFMPHLHQPYTILLLTAVGLSMALVVGVLRYRPNLGTRAFAVLMGAVAMWAFVTLFEVIAADLPTKTFSGSLKYLFIVIVPVAFFIFALYYANRLRRLRPALLGALSVIPVVTLLMVITNGHHQLMFETLGLHHTKDFTLVQRTFGPWFWVHTAYSYSLLLLGSVFLAKSLIDAPRLYRSQVVSLIVAVLTPWIFNLLFLSGAGPMPHLDLTPFAFSISGLAVMWGLVRYRLLDVVPIARDVVVQHMGDALIVLDDDQRILDLNGAALAVTGAKGKSPIGHKADRVFGWWPPPNSSHTADKLGLPTIIDLQSDGGQRRMQVTESVLHHDRRRIGHLVLLRDITEESRLQEQLLQSQKMEAIGTLAGGIAHDFNNLLMGMQANVSLLRLDAATDGPAREKLRRIENQIQSGAALTRQLLGYARKGKYVTTTVDMHHLIQEALEVVQRTNKHITVRHTQNPAPALLEADRGQMELVLLNLFVNAVDAMPRGGELQVATRPVPHGETADRWPDLAPGNYIEITVRDTGQGMDPETMARIFEPFFTTKEIGRGTGLGLASVYGVIKNHQGHIQVDSKVGEGSTFTLLLPASPAKAPAPCPVATYGGKGPSNGRKILIVDDESTILELLGEMVQSLGFTPILAGEGPAAVKLFSEHHASIDVVLLDMVMPYMDGRDVFDALTVVRPDLRVIVASGQAPNGRWGHILQSGPHRFLKKPFTRDDLSRAVQQVMAGDDSDACGIATVPS